MIRVIGDCGYISSPIRLDLFESCQIQLKVPSLKNQKQQDELPQFYAKSRKRIETVFSQLKDQFILERNYAKSMDGLLGRISSKLAAMGGFNSTISERVRPLAESRLLSANPAHAYIKIFVVHPKKSCQHQ